MVNRIREGRVTGVFIWAAVAFAVVVAAGAIEAGAVASRGGEGHDVFGSIVGGDGSALPGVLVAMSGNGVKQNTVSDSDGAFRFTSVSAGTYSLLFKKKGKKKVKREITIGNGDFYLGKITME